MPFERRGWLFSLCFNFMYAHFSVHVYCLPRKRVLSVCQMPMNSEGLHGIQSKVSHFTPKTSITQPQSQQVQLFKFDLLLKL